MTAPTVLFTGGEDYDFSGLVTYDQQTGAPSTDAIFIDNNGVYARAAVAHVIGLDDSNVYLNCTPSTAQSGDVFWQTATFYVDGQDFGTIYNVSDSVLIIIGDQFAVAPSQAGDLNGNSLWNLYSCSVSDGAVTLGNAIGNAFSLVSAQTLQKIDIRYVYGPAGIGEITIFSNQTQVFDVLTPTNGDDIVSFSFGAVSNSVTIYWSEFITTANIDTRNLYLSISTSTGAEQTGISQWTGNPSNLYPLINPFISETSGDATPTIYSYTENQTQSFAVSVAVENATDQVIYATVNAPVPLTTTSANSLTGWFDIGSPTSPTVDQAYLLANSNFGGVTLTNVPCAASDIVGVSYQTSHTNATQGFGFSKMTVKAVISNSVESYNAVFEICDAADTTAIQQQNLTLSVAEIGLAVDASGSTLINTTQPVNGSPFTLLRAQTYRTTDFFTIVPWYAQNISITLAPRSSPTTVSYSVNNPPTVSYATATIRNQIEGTTNPNNQFVQISDGTTWTWTAFDYTPGSDGVTPLGWTTVAQDNGTVAFSPQFYNSAAKIYGVNNFFLQDIANRDGSWEIRILADVLRESGILTPAEINEVLFSMLHFVHTQQNQVDWAFKTSFMVMAGFSVPLTQIGVVIDDPTSDLISYVDEVKPYRVKVRDYTQQYSISENPPANVTATDFDKPVYFDPVLNSYRTLDPNNVGDQAILETSPWSYWYDSYSLPASPVRRLTTGLIFDRVTADLFDGYAGPPYDTDGFGGSPETGTGTAIDRITNYYDGTAINSVLSYSYGSPDVMNVRFKGNEIDGGTLYQFDGPYSDFDAAPEGFDSAGFDTQVGAQPVTIVQGGAPFNAEINAPTSDTNRTTTQTKTVILPDGTTATIPIGGVADPLGYGLRDPYASAGIPEERAPIIADDGLLFRVTQNPTQGAPSQRTLFFDTTASTATSTTLGINFIAESASGILLWRDGVLANAGTDYTLDHLGQTVTVNLINNGTRVNGVLVQAFGFGGLSNIVAQQFYTVDGHTTNFFIGENFTKNQINVVLGGNRLLPSQFNYLATIGNIGFPVAPTAGQDLVITVYAGLATDACLMQLSQPSYNSTNRYNIAYPDDATNPPGAGTLVFVNGKTRIPSPTFYGSFTPDNRSIVTDYVATKATRIQVYVDGVYYNYNVPIVDAGNSNLPFGAVAAPGNTIVINTSGSFAFLNNMLVSLSPEFNAQTVSVTFFENEDYEVNGNTIKFYNNAPVAGDQIDIITFTNAGVMNIQTYSFNTSDASFPIPAPNSHGYAIVSVDNLVIVPDVDYSFSTDADGNSILVVNQEKLNGGSVVNAMVFYGSVAQPFLQWQISSTTPASVRMAPQRFVDLTPDEQTAFINLDGWAALYLPQNISVFVGENCSLTDVVHTLSGVVVNDIMNACDEADVVMVSTKPQPEFVYFMKNNVWSVVETNPVLTGTLTNPLNTGDVSFSVNYNPMISAKLLPAYPYALPNEQTNTPGVVWIDGERIEYYQMDTEGSVITFSNIRRGTSGTSVGKESKQVALYTGNGSQTIFQAPSGADVSNTEVIVNGTQIFQTDPDGTVNYTLTDTEVEFAQAPANLAEIVLITVYGLMHQQGALVYNGVNNNNFEAPIV